MKVKGNFYGHTQLNPLMQSNFCPNLFFLVLYILDGMCPFGWKQPKDTINSLKRLFFHWLFEFKICSERVKREKKWIIQRKNENKVIPLCPHRPGRDCQPTHIVRVPDSHGQPIVLTNSFALDEKTFTNFKKFQWWWRGRQVSKPRGYLFKIFKL